jgi:RhoGEF domain
MQKLEINAQDRGETGLVISLSKPFQRLLKYSMLFQALLFHTDPWMDDYDGAHQLVAEVENIIRGIENTKGQTEERDKTRDVLARIKGLDKVIQFAVPKPSRVLVEERMLNPRESTDVSKASPPAGVTGAVKKRSSFRLSSDLLRSGSGIGSRKDIWLVVFNDVELRCQRTGTTSFPLGASYSSSAISLSESQGKSKYATTGRRNSSARPRNLYRFIKASIFLILAENSI